MLLMIFCTKTLSIMIVICLNAFTSYPGGANDKQDYWLFIVGTEFNLQCS